MTSTEKAMHTANRWTNLPAVKFLMNGAILAGVMALGASMWQARQALGREWNVDHMATYAVYQKLANPGINVVDPYSVREGRIRYIEVTPGQWRRESTKGHTE